MIDSLVVRIGCVAVAGAAGALARWGLYAALHAALGRSAAAWPWGTLAVNGLGCFLFGFFVTWFRADVPADHPVRLLVFTGFLASFTTFSTFAHDTYELQVHRGLAWALLNAAVQVAVGWAALVAGISLADRR